MIYSIPDHATTEDIERIITDHVSVPPVPAETEVVHEDTPEREEVFIPQQLQEELATLIMGIPEPPIVLDMPLFQDWLITQRE